MKPIYYAHLDIRNFYATCEQNLNPRLRGKPLVVYNQSKSGNRAIIAASKEAKQLGLNRGVPITKAENLKATLIESRLETYQIIAQELFEHCLEEFENETLSISKPHIDDITLKIQNNLNEVLDLTRRVETLYHQNDYQIAIGISCNNPYAHLAAKESKKYGLIYFGKELAKKLFYPLPLTTFPGIGPKRKEILNTAGIFKIGDLAKTPVFLLRNLLGTKTAEKIYLGVLGERI